MTIKVIDLVDSNEWESGGDGYIIKAGQGQLEYNWRDFVALAEAEGKPWGLYWVIDARYSPESHKAAIKEAFPDGYFGELGLWLDIEKPLLSMTDAEYRKLPYAHYGPVVSVWRGVEAYTGVYPGWYFSPGSWDLILSGMPQLLQDEVAFNSPLWIAHYGAATPSMRGSWETWNMWQWRGEPDYSWVDEEWWETVTGSSEVVAYVISRPLSEVEICFTQGTGELPLMSAVEAAEQGGWFAAMNGGAGFDYTDATHAIPRIEGFEKVNGIPYARWMLKGGLSNPKLDSFYRAPWCMFGFGNENVYLIVTRGLEGEYGMTQQEAADFALVRGIPDLYLMDSGRSAQIEENGTMLYWPYGPAERVPQFIGLKAKTVSGGNMKGVCKAGMVANIKEKNVGTLLHQMTAGEYVYGTDSFAHTDIIDFDHYYTAAGVKTMLNAVGKVSKTNLTVTNETEPVEPPPPPSGDVYKAVVGMIVNGVALKPKSIDADGNVVLG